MNPTWPLVALVLALGAPQQPVLPIQDGQTLPLWSGAAPGALGTAETDIPAITVYLPRTMAQNTPAMIVCPGGGYAALALNHEGRLAEAEQALLKAVELEPNYAAAHNNLAVVYLTEQPPKAELARSHYQKAIDNGQPHNADMEKLLASKGAPVAAQ